MFRCWDRSWFNQLVLSLDKYGPILNGKWTWHLTASSPHTISKLIKEGEYREKGYSGPGKAACTWALEAARFFCFCKLLGLYTSPTLPKLWKFLIVDYSPMIEQCGKTEAEVLLLVLSGHIALNHFLHAPCFLLKVLGWGGETEA